MQSESVIIYSSDASHCVFLVNLWSISRSHPGVHVSSVFVFSDGFLVVSVVLFTMFRVLQCLFILHVFFLQFFIGTPMFFVPLNFAFFPCVFVLLL